MSNPSLSFAKIVRRQSLIATENSDNNNNNTTVILFELNDQAVRSTNKYFYYIEQTGSHNIQIFITLSEFADIFYKLKNKFAPGRYLSKTFWLLYPKRHNPNFYVEFNETTKSYTIFIGKLQFSGEELESHIELFEKIQANQTS